MGYRTERRTNVMPVYVTVSAGCDNCATELAPVWGIEDDGAWTTSHAKDALEITLSINFKQYYNSGPDDAKTIVLCKQCADVLVRAFPCMGMKKGEL